jgi:hypothetical protein
MPLTIEKQVQKFVAHIVIPLLERTAEIKPKVGGRVFARYPLTLVKAYLDPESKNLTFYGLCLPAEDRQQLETPCGQYPTLSDDGEDISQEAFDNFLADMKNLPTIQYLKEDGTPVDAQPVAVIYFSPVDFFEEEKDTKEDLKGDSELYHKYSIGYYTADRKAAMKQITIEVTPLDMDADSDLVGKIFKQKREAYLNSTLCQMGGCSKEDIRAAKRLYQKVMWPTEIPSNISLVFEHGLWQEDTQDDNPFITK